ncbi:hypothetical protein PENSPDRAFT_748193 [Peniophora sp. CONT]|nr:hypothetical protein PENSPDRAFT_748193 [Peniophora sp. CONT]
MPHRSTSSSSPSAKDTLLNSPYSSPRRPPGQPRTSRMQYSACGACRMRRVRCDLKDQPYNGTLTPQCGNCTERGLRCVDEFADVKAVKLLRRGRRLQQVEQVYGKSADEAGLYALPNLTPNLVPKLKQEFFTSDFFHRLFIQHPVIDPTEFLSRFIEFTKGNTSALGIAGQLITMVLVVWGVSFGVNEYGIEEATSDPVNVRHRRELTNELVREMLQLFDIHAIFRKPSFDGVRAVMLILPLTEDVQSPVERLAMHELVVTQVITLCNLSSIAPGSLPQSVDSLVRARIFWYSHIIEGVTTGLRGGRTVLTEQDLLDFNDCLQLSDPTSSSSSTHNQQPLNWWSLFSTAPLKIANACRSIHSRITGARLRLGSLLDDAGVRAAWGLLEKSWSDLDQLRLLSRESIPFVHSEDISRYCDGWQIFIFECHTVIHEAIKQRGLVNPAPGSANSSSPTLFDASLSRCHRLSRKVVAIVKQHLHAGSAFLEFDSTLAREGVFAAGFFLAAEAGTDEEVGCCVKALKLMRWAYSNADERVKTISLAWEARRSRSRQSSPSASSISSGGSYTEQRARPVPSPLAIPSNFPATFGGAEPSTPFNDGRQPTPPDSASSSVHSFLSSQDFQDPYSTRSSPASSHRPSVNSSPGSGVNTGFVAPALLHPTYAQHDDNAHMSASASNLFYDELAAYIPATHTSAPQSHAMPPMNPNISLRTGLPGGSANHHEVGTSYAPGSAVLFDNRSYVFPGETHPMGMHHNGPNVLGAPFDDLPASFF